MKPNTKTKITTQIQVIMVCRSYMVPPSAVFGVCRFSLYSANAAAGSNNPMSSIALMHRLDNAVYILASLLRILPPDSYNHSTCFVCAVGRYAASILVNSVMLFQPARSLVCNSRASFCLPPPSRWRPTSTSLPCERSARRVCQPRRSTTTRAHARLNS